MAGLSTPGLGSGLDVNSLVTQLMQAERAPYTSRLTRQQTQVATEISALGQLKGALSAFQLSLDTLRTPEKFATRSTTTSDPKVLTASATNTAAPSSYDIFVERLAKAQQLSSDPFAEGADAVVGTGTLTISLGGVAVDIEIDSEHSTLADIRTAINTASGDKGVRATIVNSSEGSHLVLSSTKTGAENVIKVTQTGGDGGLSSLVYDEGNAQTSNYDELRGAEDALIRIATFAKTSASNTITDAIEGVTLNLVAESEENTAVTLDVSYDRGGVEDRVRRFVDAYNTLKKQITTLGGYDAATEKGGPLLGDALLRSIDADSRRGLVDPVADLTGDYQTLASIGITTNKDGTLSLDATKLQTALKADFSGVSAVFSSENGIAARLYEKMGERLTATAELATRNKSLDKASKAIKEDQAAMELRMAKIEERYRKQFSALDSLLMSMQSTSNYLAEQLANLPKIGS